MLDKYEKMVTIYDAIYAFKDYEKEAEVLHQVIRENKRSPGVALLDVACGTGKHLLHLKTHYQVVGLDLHPGMITIARQHCPDTAFHQGDMLDFDLGRTFDVLTCLFSSIGYVKTRTRLDQAVANMARHLKPGGLLIIEPWFGPETYVAGGVHAAFVDDPELKIARMNVSEAKNGVSILDMHHLVATPSGVEYFIERHELGLFTDAQYRQAIREAGLVYSMDSQGLTGRGLHLGVKPGGEDGRRDHRRNRM